MLNREHCRTTSTAAPPQPMHEAHRPTALHHTTTHCDPLASSSDEQQAPYSAHFPSMQSPIHTGHHPYMSHLHNNAMDNNNSSNTSNVKTANILLTDFEPANASPLLGSAIRHNSQAYRYMHSVLHPQPMQSYDPAISMGGVVAPAATAYYAVNGEPLDPLLIHPSMPIIPMMQMPLSSSRSSRQVPQKSFSAPLSLYQFEQFLAQPPPSQQSAPSPPATSSATTYSIPIAPPLKSLDFPDALRESPNPATPTNLNEKNLGAAVIGKLESSAFVASTPTSFTENNTAITTTTAFIQPHSLSNSSLEKSPIECLPKKCSAKRSRITQSALLYLIDRFNENSTPSTAQLQVYARYLNMDVPKVRIWCVFWRFSFFLCVLDVQP
ncbi:hypothetical protein BJ741DRAFT_627766 [Chytriomyces cf. hyalinus JEL632]|nr:hypothetical protein BJ741DRAFT_627766 [Chytriomyces cf. hyalinus JEL632]